MIKITENLDKAKFEMLKAHVVNVLSAPEKWVATKDRSRMVTHWGRKWEFKCKSDTEYFYVESIFDAVDWLYEDLIADDEEEKWKLRFTTRVEPKIVRDILESLSEYSEILTDMSDTAWGLYRENGNEIHLGENSAYIAGADLFDQMRENLENDLKEQSTEKKDRIQESQAKSDIGQSVLTQTIEEAKREGEYDALREVNGFCAVKLAFETSSDAQLAYLYVQKHIEELKTKIEDNQ